MNPAPTRRWFRWSLRTLFVVVTVICCWLGWNVRQVQRRSEILRALPPIGGYSGSVADESGGMAYRQRVSPFTGRGIPLTWRLFGADRVDLIVVPPNQSNVDADEAERLFPEAHVQRSTLDSFFKEYGGGPIKTGPTGVAPSSAP